MALYEDNRRQLSGLIIQQTVAPNDEIKELIKFLYLYRGGIEDMQRDHKRREEELRTAFSERMIDKYLINF
jgi:hypothetical protein